MAGRRGATKANACSYDIASDEEGEAQLAVAGAGCAEAGSEPTDGARERPGGEDGAALADNGSVASDNEDEEARQRYSGTGQRVTLHVLFFFFFLVVLRLRPLVLLCSWLE